MRAARQSCADLAKSAPRRVSAKVAKVLRTVSDRDMRVRGQNGCHTRRTWARLLNGMAVAFEREAMRARLASTCHLSKPVKRATG